MSGARDCVLRGHRRFEGRDLLLLIKTVITGKGKGDITMITRAPSDIFLFYDDIMHLENT